LGSNHKHGEERSQAPEATYLLESRPQQGSGAEALVRPGKPPEGLQLLNV